MRNSTDQSLGDLIKDLLKAYRLNDGMMTVKVRAGWDNIMEPAILQRTREIRLSGKMLVIWVDSSVLRQELQFKKNEIIQAMNNELKEQVIESVDIR